jgi:hypothetical protein
MNTKLQRQAYKYKDKQNSMLVITLPERAITKLGWNGGQESEIAAKDNKLLIWLHKQKDLLDESRQ